MIAHEAATHTTLSMSPSRRSFLRILAAAGAFGRFLLGAPSPAEADPGASAGAAFDSLHSVKGAADGDGDESIRPFHISFPEAPIVDLRRRVAATKWPERETVADASQGMQLATMRELARYWQTDYDWRKVEARLNALPQFTTNIGGLDIHFIHVRSKNPNALPVIITHGWPGSIIERMKIIDLLTNPTAHGGSASDSFDVVIPSLPGYGFSRKPTRTGWDPQRIARAWPKTCCAQGRSEWRPTTLRRQKA